MLFIGGVFPRDDEATIVGRSKGPVQNAANALQWTLIFGFDAVLGRPITLLNAPFVGSYPKLYRVPWIPGGAWSHAPGAQDRGVAFLNLFGVKHLWRGAAASFGARRWAATRERGRPGCIVVYSLHAPFMLAAAMAKRSDPALKICVIVPDLPEHMNLGEGYKGLLRALKSVDRRVIDDLLRHMDCFVLLTRHMAGPLGVGEKPWIVMEGAVNPQDVPALTGEPPRAAAKAILYSGTLQKAYGILQLLEAFSLVEDRECQLWICGAGDAESEVRAMASRDGRVRYLGQRTRSEVLELQRRAAVLINPRGDSAEFTKYSFPSKVLEYMLSGTPAIIRMLPGIPDEYLPYVHVVEGPSAADLAAKIAEVCDASSAARAEFGARAQRFVLLEKNGVRQARRILDLMRSSSGGGAC